MPGFESELATDPAYVSLWDSKHAESRDLLLTALSEVVSSLDQTTANASMAGTVAKPLQDRKLGKAILKLSAILSRTGDLPADFRKQLVAYFASIQDNANHGVWRASKPNATPYDCAALAFWLHPDSFDYAREYLDAKRDGPLRWSGHSVKDPLWPRLAREKAALEWLALLTELTYYEQTRLTALSKVGDEPPEQVSLATMLHEYDSNEVRADDEFAGKFIEFAGVAGGLERGQIAGITLTVGTGKPYEHPEVHCFFDDSQTARVKALNKGDRVRVRGHVKGLMIDVLVEDCELVE